MRARFRKSWSASELAAEVIYKAATNPSDHMRYPAGPDARRFIPLRRVVGAGAMMKMVSRVVKL